jgi:hypothetical protein
VVVSAAMATPIAVNTIINDDLIKFNTERNLINAAYLIGKSNYTFDIHCLEVD